MKFKFNYKEIVQYKDRVGMIIDSIIQDDSINYLVKFSETNEDWLKEDDLVKYTINDGFNIGDKVSYYENGFQCGIVVDVEFNGQFKYLIELANRERYWKLGGELYVC